jgi:hypothetical protein
MSINIMGGVGVGYREMRDFAANTGIFKFPGCWHGDCELCGMKMKHIAVESQRRGGR